MLVDASDRRRSTRSTAIPGRPLPLGLRGLHGLAEATSAVRPRRWRCSPWPPSSSSWPRWSPPQASRSSRSDGSASSACSPPSARRRSTVRLVLLANGAARRDDRRGHRDDRRPRALGRLRPDARVRGRPSHRPAQPSVGADRDGRPPRRPRGNRRRLVAGANGRPPPGRARALGTTAQAEARAPLGYRGRSADRSRHRLPRPVGPRQPAAHRRRARGNDPRHPAARPAGDPHLLRRAGHAPIAPRLALRDLARYQARSGAALAAITLALGIAAAVVVTAAAEEKQEDDRAAAELPNLSDRQIRVYTGPTRDPELIRSRSKHRAQLARSAARVRQLAAGLDQATVIPLRKAVQSGEPPIVTFEGDRALVTVGLGEASRPQELARCGSGLYVATPALLRHLGIDPATIDPSADFLADPTVPTNELVILDIRARKQLRRHERPADRQPASPRLRRDEVGGLPASFVTLDGLRRHGWTQIPARLARRVEPASHQRADRRRPRARRRGRPCDRDAAQEHIPRARRSRSQPPPAPSWRSPSSR